MHIVQGDFPFHVYVLSEQHEVFQDTFLQTLKKSPVCQSFNEPCVPVLVEQYFPWDENSQNGNPQKACIVFNTEQLSRPSILERAVFQIQLEQVTQWWDQSLANIDIVKNRVSPLHALKLRHVPIVCDPEKVFILKEEQDSQDKIYDLGVIHTQTPWRNEFVDNLRKKGLCVKILRFKSLNLRGAILSQTLGFRFLRKSHLIRILVVNLNSLCTMQFQKSGSFSLTSKPSIVIQSIQDSLDESFDDRTSDEILLNLSLTPEFTLTQEVHLTVKDTPEKKTLLTTLKDTRVSTQQQDRVRCNSLEDLKDGTHIHHRDRATHATGATAIPSFAIEPLFANDPSDIECPKIPTDLSDIQSNYDDSIVCFGDPCSEKCQAQLEIFIDTK